jgi:pimeloyl-ACP methyl ester carboxylesterase
MKPRTRRLACAAAILLSTVVSMPVGASVAAGEPAGTIHRSGVFPDGQEWQISVPPNWNGILVNDLDSVGDVQSQGSRSTYFLDHGYAYTGTRRHPDRGSNWDPRAESINMEQVLDIFEAEFGEPRHAIQFGCSGGGSVGLAVAEDHPGRFDGVVSLHASDPTTLANQRLDLVFALKALLDPDGDLPLIVGPGETDAAGEAWRAALAQWRQTPLGRARMALALTLAQYPTWGTGEKPAANDRQAVEDAMMASVEIGVLRAITGRPQWDLPAGIMSWTTGIDYQKFYENADAFQKGIVGGLYAKAGKHGANGAAKELGLVNAYPRIAGTLSGVNYWRSRMTSGTPLIPVLQISTIGDAETPPSSITRYEQAVRANGRGALYRTAYIDAPGHCGFNVPEMAAAVDTMVARIESGQWGSSATASALNATAAALGVGTARFIEPGRQALWSKPTKLNRAFFPSSPYPGDVADR